MRRFFGGLCLALLPFLFSGCVGGTLSEKGSFEEYQLVPATPKEETRIRSCLESIFEVQQKSFQKRQAYITRTNDLRLGIECGGILVGLRGNKTHYTGVARINHDESTVRWTINEKHEIYEHTDTDMMDDVEW